MMDSSSVHSNQSISLSVHSNQSLSRSRHSEAEFEEYSLNSLIEKAQSDPESAKRLQTRKKIELKLTQKHDK
jgi:hypothetical protein